MIDSKNNNLYNQIIDFENILEAYNKAKKGRRYKTAVLNFSFNSEKNLNSINYCLSNKKYYPGSYYEFIIKDSKKRTIEAVPFRDRVIHHSLCNIIGPIFNKSFIPDSYACRENKGAHKANKQLRKYLKSIKDKNNLLNYSHVYYLKCDISKYFNNVDHNILSKIIQRKIKDENVLWLINLIINSYHKDTNIGIPIGNLTSQLFANIYLNELDFYIKNILKCKYYIRYMDDFILLDASKHKLWEYYNKIKNFVSHELKLTLKDSKTMLSSADQGISFLGYVIFPDKVLLRSSTIKRFYKKVKKSIKEIENEQEINRIINKKFKNWYSYYHNSDYYRFIEIFYESVLKKHIPNIHIDQVAPYTSKSYGKKTIKKPKKQT